MAGAGDVNGDGFDDLLVGVPYWDAGDHLGAALLFLGSASGIPSGAPDSASARLHGTGMPGSSDPDEFGASVAGAGDVNGDGYDDVIVGAPEAGENGQLDEGAAFVFLGGAAGIPAAASSTAAGGLESNRRNANFGGSVSAAGDVNGDGMSDVIVGAQLFGAGGAAFVFLGEADADYYGASGPVADNCESRTNPRQMDADLDGHGNACDADLNQDGITGGPDFGVFVRCLGKSVPAATGPPHDPTCSESDMNDDGIVGGADFGLFVKEYASPPGP